MKKTVLWIAASVLLLSASVLSYFLIKETAEISSKNNATETTTDTVANETHLSDEAVPTKKEDKKEDKKDKKSQKHTLLIYMIGSDLESRSAAGTDDMEEISKSGIDLNKNNVIIFAGGTVKWHNDVASADKVNVLKLTPKGFTVVEQMDTASMGTSKSLADFLNYGYKNFPADSFSLIMWNHGNGPNIGYGKDMLFGSDSLTLAEMQSALAASPFNSSNKLEWVGFDACLMSTTELVCVWDDYAKYLVASQEIEPSFGWNYDVLRSYNSGNTRSFLSSLTDNYLSTCLEYFNKRGYSGKEATLACIDLSYGKELENATNALFDKASADIETKYSDIVRRRVSSRALGRASTGSEYDLVDLQDMAIQLSDLYPEETAALNNVIRKMIVNNGTNAELVCGLSLYYPFYNKYHYEQSWADAYKNIGALGSYKTFLEKYKDTWLLETDLSIYEKSPVPQEVTDPARNAAGESVFILPLSPEQAKNFAEAKVYVLERATDNNWSFQNIITSANVRNEDGVLHADIGWNAIYVKNSRGKSEIPITVISDTVGDITRYICQINAIENDILSPNYGANFFNVHLALNTAENTLSTTAVYPSGSNTDLNNISGGKLEDFDLNDYDEYSLPRTNYRFPIRNSKGLILPMDKWISDGWIVATHFPKEFGLQFVYEKMSPRTYYIMFEITDTQGGKYCSEILPVTPPEGTHQSGISIPEPGSYTFDWDNGGNDLVIFDRENITVKLRRIFDSSNEPQYIVIAENKNDYPVEIQLKSRCINGLSLGDTSIWPEANSSETSNLFSFSDIEPAVNFGLLEKIDQIEFTLDVAKICETETGKLFGHLIESYFSKGDKITIKCSESSEFPNLIQYTDSASADESEATNSYRDAYAEKQILYNNQNMRITFLSLKDNGYAYILYENLSDVPQAIGCNGICINGKTVDGYGSANTLPGKSFYLEDYLLSSGIQNQKINFIESMSFRITSENRDHPLFDTPDGAKWFPVKFEQTGKDSEIPVAGKVIYDENDIRITITGYKAQKSASILSPIWYAVIENNSSRDASLKITMPENKYENLLPSILLSSTKVGAHQKLYTSFSLDKGFSNKEKSISFNIHIMDFDGYGILFPASKPTTLYGDEEMYNSSSIISVSSEKTEIARFDGFTLYLEKSGDSYSLIGENNLDKTVYVYLKNICINQNIALQNDESLYCLALKSKSEKLIFDHLLDLGVFDRIDSISGNLSVNCGSSSSDVTLAENVPITFEFADGYKTKKITKPEIQPFASALAEEQILFENKKVRITLLYFGTYIPSGTTDRNACLYFENIGDTDLTIKTEALSLNSITMEIGTQLSLTSGQKTCRYVSIDEDFIRDNEITSVGEVKFFFGMWESLNTSLFPYQSISSKVSLSQKGEIPDFTPGDNILFEQDGVKIILNKFYYEAEIGSSLNKGENTAVWDMTIINDTDKNIRADFNSLLVNNINFFDFSCDVSADTIAAHERINCKLSFSGNLQDGKFTRTLFFKTLNDEAFIVGDEPTIFSIEEELIVTPHLDALAEEQTLWETEDFRLKLVFFGNSNLYKKNFLFMLENLSNKPQNIKIEDFSVNSITLPPPASYFTQAVILDAKAHETVYAEFNFLDNTLSENGITSIETLAVAVTCEDASLPDADPEVRWIDISLKESGKADEFITGDNVIFDKGGVKIIFEGFEYIEDGRPAWNVSVINDTDHYIRIRQGIRSLLSTEATSAKAEYYIYADLQPNEYVGPHQKVKGKFVYDGSYPHESFYFRPSIVDYNNYRLYKHDEMIVLSNDGKTVTTRELPPLEADS